MNNFKQALWPLLKDYKEEIQSQPTARTSFNTQKSQRLATDARRTIQFELTSVYGSCRSSHPDRNSLVHNIQDNLNNISNITKDNIEKKIIYKNQSYQLLNLTWTLYTVNPPKQWFSLLFGLSLILRLYIFLYLLAILYLTLDGSITTKWMWTLVVVGTRVIYSMLVLRVCLCYSNGPLDVILKNCWNKNQIVVNEAFQVLTWVSVKRSVIKALIPPELSFIYLSHPDVKRKFLMFSVINYIFLGIETMLFYPFFIFYCFTSLDQVHLNLNKVQFFSNISVAVSVFWILIFCTFSMFLLMKGVKIKYQKMTI